MYDAWYALLQSGTLYVHVREEYPSSDVGERLDKQKDLLPRWSSVERVACADIVQYLFHVKVRPAFEHNTKYCSYCTYYCSCNNSYSSMSYLL